MGAHDLQFRNTFRDPDMFREACEIYLPKEVKDKINFSTLKLRQMSGSFIRNLIIQQYNIDPQKDAKLFEQLKEEIADIVYSCECYDGSQVLLISHAEHQSKADKDFPIRNALYDISALKDYIDTNKPDKYPLVISFLVYHGKQSPYPYPTDINQKFEHSDLAKKYFLKPILIDYGQYSDEQLLGHGQLSGLEIAFKHSFDDEVDDNVVKNLMQGLQKCSKIELRRDWYMYALKTWESSANTMIKQYKNKLSEDEVFVMTAEQQLIAKGALLKAQETAINMINKGYSDNDVEELTGLDKSTLKEIKKNIKNTTRH
ncbi:MULTISPECIES: Rpn family recombination-promoting nuclease/putative transposase [Cysteiniphilum]|uniref:Transposase (putative) YhgA-like domain-containing protein n=1 Tax=Cysteiniphilum litorale TaxID=2056700 RepID=A0A8J2Z6W2_9GAMM|nr:MULTISPECIES: Rpn family recombination-promoting nuclease/putative transposase [Cysteiniphilum]GGG08671.1 hypothetical protein GCM10010995_27780 [Cysteiniphilum litorale]